MRLQRRGNGDVVLGVAIQHVHEILLLDRAYELLNCKRKTDHEGATGGIHRQVLSGQTANHAHLSEGLLMDLLEHVLLAVELENDHTSAVGSNDDEINIIACVSEEKTIPTRESERLHRSDQSVHFEAANHVDVASIIGSPEFDDVSARHDKLLDPGRTEVS